MKNYFKKITLFILSFTLVFVLASCGQEEQQEEQVPAGDGEIEFTDVVERPDDIPPLADLEYAVYPSKPEGLIAGQPSGVVPTYGDMTTPGSSYKINHEEGKITITYNEVSKWDYVFLPITNFNQEYQNIKITATGTNVYKVGIAAVYVEMYDLGYPAVGVLTSDVGDNEQFYTMQLGKKNIINESYDPTDTPLGTQTVFGLCIFLDSNPSQPVIGKNTEKGSTFEITNIEFLKDDDKGLEQTYVDPSLNIGHVDAGYTAEKDESTKAITIVKDSSAAVWTGAQLSVVNYSSAYSAFDMTFTTTGVNTLSIEIIMGNPQPDWAENVMVYKETNLGDGEHKISVDFSSVQPTNKNTWESVPGYYVKNYDVIAIKIVLDTAEEVELNSNEGVCVISEIKFDRMETSGILITKGWNPGSGNIELGDDLMAGGIGTIKYSWYKTWEYMTMTVLNYQPCSKLTITFEAPDGIDYLGIALGSGQYSNKSQAIFTSQGEAVIKSCWDPINGGAGQKEGEAAGIVETVVYDEATKIYTITFDFTNATKFDGLDGKSINEVSIDSLRFYFTDPNGTAEFDGQRTIRFISVEFTPYEAE